jgi:predicted membrane-bound spermidine synthase
VAVERLASAHSPRGELVLRRRDEVLELISNGTFLMDTSGGASESAMAELALADIPRGARVLVAGMGFGFTLAATLSFMPAEVVVVELEPDVIAWNRAWWPLGRDALEDPRVRVIVGDFAEYLRTADHVFDVVLVDIDNGPDWTVAAPNDDVYIGGLTDLRRLVRAPNGRLCVWSAHASLDFEARLAGRFADVTAIGVPAPRGEPDILYLATGPSYSSDGR